MKRKVKRMVWGILLCLCLLQLAGCKKNKITSISIDENTLVQEVLLSEFDYADIGLIVTRKNGTSETVPLNESMFSVADLAQLSQAGTHTITVNYEGFATTFAITLYASQLDRQLHAIYKMALAEGSAQTYEEWLETVRGEQGLPGVDGKDGASAYDLAVTGGYEGTLTQWLASLRGASGASAYGIAVAGGYQGTEEQWLASLKGLKGDTGVQGIPGINGKDGASAYDMAVAGGYQGTLSEWLESLKGAAGASAYEIAVTNGYQGTEVEWLESLKGLKGDPGPQGIPGIDGVNGASAFDLAVAGGYQGTLSEWLESLKGAKGDQGVQGSSAYEVAVQGGYMGTLDEWLASLKGDTGAAGRSAYEIYLQYHPDYTKSEEEWIDDLANGRLAEVLPALYSVYFDAGEGSLLPGEPSFCIVPDGGQIDILPLATRDGYRFLGWFTGVSVNDGQFTTLTPVTGNRYLYARWELEQKVFFVDDGLEAAVRNVTGIYDRPLYESDVTLLEGLDAQGYSISDLSGIEQLTSLLYLNLFDNAITDITPLLKVKNLVEVSVMNNPVNLDRGSANYRTVLELSKRGVFCDLNSLMPDDYGNSLAEATSMTVPASINAVISSVTDEDWFSITLVDLALITIYSNSIINMQCFLYDQTGIQINYDDNSRNGIDFEINTVLGAGTYYIKVCAHGETGPYELVLEVADLGDEIVFADEALEQVVRDSCKVYDRPLYASDVATIEILEAFNLGIKDLSGISHLVSLQALMLMSNDIQDITELTSLPELMFVLLGNNPITLSEGSPNYNTMMELYGRGIVIDLIGQTIPDDYEDVPELATAITFGSTVAGTFEHMADTDYFQFTLVEEAIIRITRNFATGFLLLDSTYEPVGNNLMYEDPFMYYLPAGTYYLGFIGFDVPDYEFTIDYLEAGAQVTFTNSELEKAVRSNLELFAQPLYEGELLLIKTLNMNFTSLVNLTDLEKLPNLEYLYANYCQITDITNLVNAPNLKEVYLYGNPLDLTLGNANYNSVRDLIGRGVICDLCNLLADDHGSSFATATVMTLGTSIEGITTAFDQDYFIFTLATETAVDIYNTGNIVAMGYLYNNYLDMIASDEDLSTPEMHLKTTLAAGTYYLVISSYNTIGAYVLYLQEGDFGDAVTFGDPVLDNLVRTNIGLPAGTIYEEYLSGVTDLDGDGAGILSLSGMEYLTGLVHVHLRSNSITDITPLSALTQLQEVLLGNNPIDLAESTPNHTLVQAWISGGVLSDLSGQLVPDDHADIPQAATPIMTNSDIYANLEQSYDTDYFTFTLSEESYLVISSLNVISIMILDVDLRMITEIKPYDIFNSSVILPSGTYYLGVFGGMVTEYNFAIDLIDKGDPVTFSDINLETVIRTQLMLPPRTLYQADVGKITYLDARFLGINQLGGIENLVNLETLMLDGNYIVDISLLLQLPKLEMVTLNGNMMDLSLGSPNYNVLRTLLDAGITCDLYGLLPDDYGNTLVSSQFIALGEPLSGIITSPADNDWFTFTLVGDASIMIYTSGNGNTSGSLFRVLNLINNDEDSGDGLNFRIYAELTAGTYYVSVTAPSATVYELHVEIFDPGEPIVFADASFEMLVRNRTGIKTRNIYPFDVAEISDLVLYNAGISDISGIEYFTSLTLLNFHSNHITDISALMSLPYLQMVLGGNNPFDLSEGSANYLTIQDLMARGVQTDLTGLLVPDDYADAPQEAIEILFYQSCAAVFEDVYDTDCFKFTMAVSGTLQLDTTGIFNLLILDSNYDVVYETYQNFSIYLEQGTYCLLFLGLMEMPYQFTLQN